MTNERAYFIALKRTAAYMDTPVDSGKGPGA